MRADYRHCGWRAGLAAALVCSVAPWTMGASAEPASSPATTPAVAPVSAPAGTVSGSPVSNSIDAAFRALERLDVRGNIEAGEVDAVVEPALAEAGAVKQDLLARLAVLEKDRASGDRQRTADAQRLRERLCSLELLIADLHLSAGRLLGAQAGQPHLEHALQIYRQARVEHRTANVSALGYIGEAKACRARREYDQALAALKTVLDMTRKPSNNAQAELGRLAAHEELEILLAQNPDEALREISTWRASRGIASETEWSARADWLLARATAARSLKRASGPGDAQSREAAIQEALAALRVDAVVRIGPSHERLSLMLQLESRAGRDLLSGQELLQWADLLALAGAANAVDFYARAAKTAVAMPVDSALRYAALLFQAQSYGEAAEVCQTLQSRVDLEVPHRNLVNQFAAACRVRQFQAADTPALRQAHADAASRALKLVVESDAPDDLRQDALRQWCDVVGRSGMPGDCVRMLEAHAGLVGDDGYLLYVLAAGKWEQAKASSPGSAEGPGRALVDEVGSLLDRATQSAKRAGQQAIEARCVLLRSTIKASPAGADKQGALGLLLAAWDLFAVEPELAREAAQRRLELLVDLGLTEDALGFVDTLPPGKTGSGGSALLSLAEVLADRVSSAAAGARDSDRQRVIGLCQRAVVEAVHDGRDAGGRTGPVDAATVLTAARILLKAGAARDARALLDGLPDSALAGDDKAPLLEKHLLMVDAWRQEGNLNQAIAACDKLAKDFPRDLRLLVARGRLSLAADNPADAAKWFREARDAGQAGSAEWCEATLGLIEALIQDRQTAEAANLSRVCLVLYPEFGNPQLLASLKQLQARALPARP